MTDAAAMLQLSYRQVKRSWRRYRQMGSPGLQHGNVGRVSNRSKPAKFRRRILNLIKQKYSGSEEKRFGPTLAAEHLAQEDGIVIDHDKAGAATASFHTGEALCSLPLTPFGLLMGMIILTSNTAGVLTGEWKGISRESKHFLVTGMVVILAALGMLTFGQHSS